MRSDMNLIPSSISSFDANFLCSFFSMSFKLFNILCDLPFSLRSMFSSCNISLSNFLTLFDRPLVGARRYTFESAFFLSVHFFTSSSLYFFVSSNKIFINSSFTCVLCASIICINKFSFINACLFCSIASISFSRACNVSFNFSLFVLSDSADNPCVCFSSFFISSRTFSNFFWVFSASLCIAPLSCTLLIINSLNLSDNC
ncbi:membrane protein [Bathymodiolus azoricus thioautotrophic gill symbiont]|uniref:Membrane protein n=1 Tax=Bathymodiolus azoricus thioautotrophic gill symbiont TaxID=235205 RepID=A0A1H6K630_9GAMM|nr:membrane protein [Bathymodiolus azoricus thioautotrophic gill symbiont]